MPRSLASGGRRVVMVQYAGDYREAFTRLSNGGAETYYGQRYSVTSVGAMRARVDALTVIACLTGNAYDEVLPNGVRAIGAGMREPVSAARILAIVEAARPTDLVVCTPMRELLAWAVRNRVRTLALLADSFPVDSMRARFRNYRLARLLQQPQVEWVANHNVNASHSLASIGVPPEKIIPWDWAPQVTPQNFPAKMAPLPGATLRLLYVGQITEPKGVSDLLRALAMLKARGRRVHLQVAGNGDVARFEALAAGLGIGGDVQFLGPVPNASVVPLMREADVVVIPSRHEYPEGLPLTIYEALCSRTPIVASDHPMFRGKLTAGASALLFPAGDPAALADAVETLAGDPALYGRLSLQSAAAWEALQIPVKFADLLERWIGAQPADRDWLFQHRLNSGLYGAVH